MKRDGRDRKYMFLSARSQSEKATGCVILFDILEMTKSWKLKKKQGLPGICDGGRGREMTRWSTGDFLGRETIL